MTSDVRYVRLAEGDDKAVHRIRRYDGGHMVVTDCGREFVAYDLLHVDPAEWLRGPACGGCAAYLLALVVDGYGGVWAEVSGEDREPSGWFKAVNRDINDLWQLDQIVRMYGLRSVE